MTQTEIRQRLRLGTTTVVEGVRRAAEYTPSIKKKYIDGKLWCETEFNLEETVAIYEELGCNELQLLLLKENWEDKSETDVYTITGTNKALKENNLTKKCCNTCEYLVGKTSSSMILRPYCTLYNRLLDRREAIHKVGGKSSKINVYEDYCKNYTYKKQEKVRVWYKNKESSPINVNQFGEIDTVNGIEREKLNKKRKRDEPIRIVTQVGFD